MKNFTFRALLGFFARAILVTPFALLVVNMGKYSEWNDNIAIFVAIVLGIATLLYLAVMVFVPAEYAIKTNVDVIAFHMSPIQKACCLGSSIIMLCLSVWMATMAFYWSAIVLLLYAISLFMWPKYIKKVDNASKDFMMQQLQAK